MKRDSYSMSSTETTNIKTVNLPQTEETKDSMIVVDHVSMVFNMANERIQSLKEYFIKAVRRELMFKEFVAVNDVSFIVEKGDVFGLVGSNGSGKSTMLKIIAGVLEPSKGTCSIKGSIAPLIELGAGFDMELSARENIYLNGALLGYSKQFIEEHFDNIVDFAEVGDFLEMPMKNYSSGMVARIAFAIATETVPDVLIVDEVLSVGDFMFQKKCEKRISSLIEDHGVTVLIVSHDSKLIERLCNKAIWIEKGHTKAIGSAKEICDLYRILGGNSKNPESEGIVKKIFDANIEIDQNCMRSISSEDRYHLAAKICERALNEKECDTVVLSSGENPNICFIANSLAGLTKAAQLLVRNESVPSVTLDTLSRIKPTQIILVTETSDSNESLLKQIENEIDCETHLISGSDLDEIALNSYLFGMEKGYKWPKIAAITHKDCISDHNAFSAIAYKYKIPVFFNNAPGVIPEHTAEIITTSIDNLAILGGFVSFPNECIEQLTISCNNLKTVRFYADNGYDSSIQIADWALKEYTDISLSNIFISSVWSPDDALALGQLAAKSNSIVIMEDPQELDGVVSVFNYISNHRSEIERLTFVGNDDQYDEQDKKLLAKALKTPPFELEA